MSIIHDAGCRYGETSVCDCSRAGAVFRATLIPLTESRGGLIKGDRVTVDHSTFKGDGVFQGWVYPRHADPFETHHDCCARSAAVLLENGNTVWFEEPTVRAKDSP